MESIGENSSLSKGSAADQAQQCNKQYETIWRQTLASSKLHQNANENITQQFLILI